MLIPSQTSQLPNPLLKTNIEISFTNKDNESCITKIINTAGKTKTTMKTTETRSKPKALLEARGSKEEGLNKSEKESPTCSKDTFIRISY